MSASTCSASFFILALSSFVQSSVNGECDDVYEEKSCKILQARSLCSMFQQHCRRTCEVCQPPTSEPTFSTATELNTPPISTYAWSRCTKTCGVGSQYRYVEPFCRNPRNPRCERRFRECNIGRCPEEICIPPYYKKRYSGGTCCRNMDLTPFTQTETGNRQVKNTFPWMVMVTAFGDGCTGVLIHKRWVLTRADCVTSGMRRINPLRVFVYVGIERVSDASARSRYSVRRSVIHPKFGHDQNNIALLQLRESVSSNFVVPISLPRGERTPTDSTCVVSGWGLSGPGNFMKRNDALEHLREQVMNMAICRRRYHSDPLFHRQMAKTFPKLMCAGSLALRNRLCDADFGSALFCQRCTSCDWYLSGISAASRHDTCGIYGYSSLFSQVRAFESWICRYVPGLDTRRSRCPYQYGP